MSKGGVVAGSLAFGLAAAVGVGIATDRIQFADKQHAYQDGLSFATPFGGRVYIDDQPYSEEDEILLWSKLYNPNVSLTTELGQQIVGKLTAIEGCYGEETVRYVPENPAEPSQDMRVCLDLGNTSLSGYTIVLPLRLEQMDGIPPQIIDFPKRTPECAQMAYDYALLANGIILDMLGTGGEAVDPDTLIPLDIRMNSEQRDQCDMSAVDGAHR